MKTCIFVAAGDISDKYFNILMQLKPRPYVLAIDGGYKYLTEHGCAPDGAIGDFDSLGYIPDMENVELHPVRKDKPDMQLAVDKAVEMGFDTAYVLGAFGGNRLDHTYANFQTLLYAKPALKLIYLDDKAFCTVISDETVVITDDSFEITKNNEEAPRISLEPSILKSVNMREAYLSLFAADRGRVTIKGCSYTGEKLELTNNFPLGLSNYMTDEVSSVKADGAIILIFSGKNAESNS